MTNIPHLNILFNACSVFGRKAEAHMRTLLLYLGIGIILFISIKTSFFESLSTFGKLLAIVALLGFLLLAVTAVHKQK